MKIKSPSILMTIIASLAAPVQAHHAVNAQFDVNQIISFTGVLRKVELINPHSYLRLTTTDETGKEVLWGFETATPAVMKRLGISPRDNLIVGQTYRLFYSPSRNGAPIGLMSAIILNDGRMVGTGSPNSAEQVRDLLAREAADKNKAP